ncbi:MAG: flagellar biosynthetic protein FliR [Actinomycetia bacterium]|jgi:flagellar biosynthetic protein FliR|nr:flagellar biosynthetic protein FliR [Actinomycetes bacterium]
MFELGISTEQIMGFLLVFARVGAWVWLTPPFGGGFLPPLVRIMSGLAFAIPMTPGAIAASGGISLDPVNLLLQFALQVVIGVALGLACLTLLSAVQSAGSMIDLASGLSLSAAYDPLMQQQSTVINRVYQLVAGVLILVTGAYLILFAGFAKTFEVLPIGNGLSLDVTAATLTSALSVAFVAVLQIAGPIIAVLFLADIGLGLLTRVAPTINIFVLSFPVKIGVALLLVGVAIPRLTPVIAGLTDSSVDAMRGIVGK